MLAYGRAALVAAVGVAGTVGDTQRTVSKLRKSMRPSAAVMADWKKLPFGVPSALK